VRSDEGERRGNSLLFFFFPPPPPHVDSYPPLVSANPVCSLTPCCVPYSSPLCLIPLSHCSCEIPSPPPLLPPPLDANPCAQSTDNILKYVSTSLQQTPGRKSSGSCEVAFHGRRRVPALGLSSTTRRGAGLRGKTTLIVVENLPSLWGGINSPVRNRKKRN